jgi:hypothetical protein
MNTDFAKLFVIEIQTDKGWEIVNTTNSLSEAVRRFRQHMLASSETVARLTSPIDTSIYE